MDVEESEESNLLKHSIPEKRGGTTIPSAERKGRYVEQSGIKIKIQGLIRKVGKCIKSI